MGLIQIRVFLTEIQAWMTEKRPCKAGLLEGAHTAFRRVCGCADFISSIFVLATENPRIPLMASNGVDQWQESESSRRGPP